MARLTIDGDELVLGFGLRDRLAIRVGRLRVPLASVTGVAVQEEPWRCLRGRRERGLDVAGGRDDRRGPGNPQRRPSPQPIGGALPRWAAGM